MPAAGGDDSDASHEGATESLSDRSPTDASRAAWRNQVESLSLEEQEDFGHFEPGDLASLIQDLRQSSSDAKSHSRLNQINNLFLPVTEAAKLYLPAASMMAQADPHSVATLTVGALAGVIRLSQNFREFQELLLDWLDKFAWKADILEKYQIALYKYDEHIQDILIKIYGDIFSFCRKARRILVDRKSKSKRVSISRLFRTSLRKTFNDAFGSIIKDYEVHMSQYLDRAELCRSQLLLEVKEDVRATLDRQNEILARTHQEPAKASPVGNTLGTGASLMPGEYLLSPDGRFQLIYQEDGNLVLYGPRREPRSAMWATGTHQKTTGFVLMQPDGNLVIYDGEGLPLWASHTAHAHNDGDYRTAYLRLQNNGNLVMLAKNSSRVLWKSHTGGCKRPENGCLYFSHALITSESLYSPDKNFRLSMQPDGSLVIIDARGTVSWKVKTDGPPHYWALMMKQKGLLLMSKNMKLLATVVDWENSTAQYGRLIDSSLSIGKAPYVALGDDGILRLYTTDGSVYWQNK